MGLITLPYSLTAHTDAKAAEVMADFNKLLTLVNGNLDAANLAAGAVTTEKLATGAVTKEKLATGFSRKQTVGNTGFVIGNGFSYSAQFVVAHGLAEVPSHFSAPISSVLNWTISMDCRVIAWDATYVYCQVIASSNMPGAVGSGNFNGNLLWAAWGQ